MRYNHETGAFKKSNKKYWWLSGLGFLLLVGGLYMLFLTAIVPTMPAMFGTKPVKALAPPKVGADKLYIPSLSLTLNINSGGVEALNNGVWHRFPERGDPANGGNFILAGHRFSIAFTPQDIVKKSPLYNADKLKEGDQLYVDFSGQRYIYTITKKYTVKPTQVSIEEPSPDNPHMTLYTCSKEGAVDGRLVFTAKLANN